MNVYLWTREELAVNEPRTVWTAGAFMPAVHSGGWRTPLSAVLCPGNLWEFVHRGGPEPTAGISVGGFLNRLSITITDPILVKT